MKNNQMIIAADRGRNPHLSSTVKGRLAMLLCTVAVGMTAPAFVPPAMAQNEIGGDVQPLMVKAAPPPIAVQPLTNSISNAVYEWKSLQQADNFPFASYARFLTSNPGWPDEARMRKNAETMLRSDGETPATVVAFFKKFPPQTATAHLRYAEALDALLMKDEARNVARMAWVSGSLTPVDESRLVNRFGSALTTVDHDIRMDKLLWTRATTTAQRQILLVSPPRRAFFDARLAFLLKSPDALSKAATLAPQMREDAGFIADRTFWLRNTNQVDAARAYLAQPLRVTAPPTDPTKWLQMIETTAKGAADAGQHGLALEISKKVELTYPAGRSVRDTSFAERDSYTNIVWLGGQSALTKLNRAGDAQRMFELYARAARSPQTKAKGLYWAGRAAERANKAEIAKSYFTEGGEYFDQFYGQLALEKLGRKPAVPLDTVSIAVSGAERDAFYRNSAVRAAILLGEQGSWQDQSKFVRAIANNANSAVDHVLSAELATKINRQDLSLLVGKSAREDGLSGYFKPAFPTVEVPADHRGNWTMVHAITRQESQFDRAAMSRVGARGLMQLMPGTAREVSRAAGVPYDLGRLTEDRQYNMRLGSTYFGQLMSQYGGSYVLSVAAYNAGPGNVNKWIRAYGDPRLPGVDKLSWIESIPFSETRGYVQRVLENAVVYDLLNPNRAANRPTTALSAFLGGNASSFGSR
jgi:soluble lytic murein transglycosylase